jgi:hypothetical protein
VFGKGENMDATFVINRSETRDVYPIKQATWNLYEDVERGGSHLTLQVIAGRSICDQTDNNEPWWEVNLVEPRLAMASLLPGAQFSVPRGFDESRGEHLTNLLDYGVHQDTDQNVVRIIAVEGNRLLVHLQGQATDGGFVGLSLETWFVHHPAAHRSIA